MKWILRIGSIYFILLLSFLILQLKFIDTIALAEESTILPRTGQTTSYAAGDDGAIQAGVPWPVPRFTDNGNGTVTDNLTGLMWLKDANCIKTKYPAFDNDGSAVDGVVTWQHALDFVAGINAGTYSKCGARYNDWRLPNINELESLVNTEQANPAMWLNSQGFANVKGPHYWSSTTIVIDTAYVWNVDMWQGNMGDVSRAYGGYVWPVRAATSQSAQIWKTGQTTCYDEAGNGIPCNGTRQDGDIQDGVAWPSPRFSDNGDGTITDNLTGLMWLKDATCFGEKTWQNALNTIANFNVNPGNYNCQNYIASYTDWRLPNRKELHSLTDFSQYDPSLPSGHSFTNLLAAYYWSSTTYALNTEYAWVVIMRVGILLFNGKSSNSYVWPVRTGSKSTTTTTTTIAPTTTTTISTITTTIPPSIQTIHRSRPQVIMAGFDPAIIDINDDRFDVVAVVRPRQNPIRSVSLSLNQTQYSQSMSLSEILPNGDYLYRATFNFSRGSILMGTELGFLWGDQPGEINITVIDSVQLRHSYPNLEILNAPDAISSVQASTPTITPPKSIKRVGTQVIAAGFDPTIVDLSDDRFDVVALVRAGSVPISTVTISLNQSNFSMSMTRNFSIPNGDEIWRATFNFARGSILNGTILGFLWGDEPGEINITAMDQAQQRHSFPYLIVTNSPAIQ